MTKSELIDQLATRFTRLKSADIKEAVSLVLTAMTDALSRDDRVEVRGFGSFSTVSRQPRKARNPKTGERVLVPSKVVPHFKAGKELRENVDRADDS